MTIEFNVNESREMNFDLSVAGANPQDLIARFFIVMNEMSLSFPAKVENGKITIKVPALNNLVKIGLNEGDMYNARLEVIVEESTLIPWKGQIKIKRPINVEARMVEMKEAIDNLKLDVKVGNPEINIEKINKDTKEICEKDHKDLEKKKKEKRKSKLAERFK